MEKTAILCKCCREHGGFGEKPNQNSILDVIVKCPECGEDCSCDGCVADAQEEG